MRVQEYAVLPNFLVIGTQKAATTWLTKCLGEHPEVFIPESKEIYFFTRHFGRGVRWYESQFGDWSGEKAVGEGSVSYICRQRAPGRILATLGDGVKLIASLRHPVERAYSAYRMYLSRGRIPQEMAFRSFLQQDMFSAWTYGFYAAQLGRYLELFPRENLLVLLFEEIRADGQKAVSDCLEFLGVNPRFVPPSLADRVNIGVDVSVLHYQIWGTRRALKMLPPLLEKQLVSIGRRVFGWLPKKKRFSPLSEDLREELLNDYLPDIKRLEGLLDRDLSIWHSPCAEPGIAGVRPTESIIV
jgi:hypothetical protein